MQHTAHTFGKQERLCSRKAIDRLYSEGHRLMAFPFSVQWMAVEPGSLPEGTRCQVMIVAPKRKLHHAVDRNRLRRLARECYRQRKPVLYDYLERRGLCIVFSMVYVHHELPDYGHLGRKMDKLLASLQADIERSLPPATSPDPAS